MKNNILIIFTIINLCVVKAYSSNLNPSFGTVAISTLDYKDNPSAGNVIIIKHENNVETFYCHLGTLKVKSGQKVFSGDVIALMGTSGKAAGEPHLHFEVKVNSVLVDPIKYFTDTNK